MNDERFFYEEEIAKRNRIARRRKYIREFKTKIEILSVMPASEERFREIDECYRKIVPYALEERIELDVVYDYIAFLNAKAHNKVLAEKISKDLESLFSV